MEKMLPNNIEAEKVVLGSIVIDAEAIVQVADFLKVSDFHSDAHAIIYEACLAFYHRRERADFITLCDELERTRKLEAAGGASYITSLVSEVPTSHNIEQYGRIVAARAQQRAMIRVAGLIAQMAYDGDSDALPRAEQALFALGHQGASSGFKTMSELMSDYMDVITRIHENRGATVGVPTCYADLDAATGGLQKSDLIILGGRPGSGKTALATNIAYNAARKGYGVAIFSLEMSDHQLVRRLMGMETGINTRRLQDGWFDDDDWDSVVDGIGKLSDLPMYINDAPGNPIASMRSQLRRLTQTSPIDLIIVDYIQLIEAEHSGGRGQENRVNEVSAISRGLKLIAKEFDVPVLALAQLSRKVEERSSKIPILSDLRESGSLEQDADTVWFMYRDDYYAEAEGRERTRPNMADVHIAKFRNGSPGCVTLFFKAEQTKFESLEAIYHGPTLVNE